MGEREAMATCARSGRPTPGMISEAMAQKRSSSRTRSDDGSSESGSPVSFASPPGSPVASVLHGTSVPRVRSHLNSGLHSPFSHSSLSRASSCTGSDAGSILHVEPSAHLSDIIVLKHVAPDQRSAAQVQRVLDMTRSDDSDQVVFARKGWPVITNAPVNLQAALARQVQVALVKAGRKIASEGSKVVRSYFVVHGHVSVREDLVTATGAGNKDQPFRLRTLAMGDTFGELPAGPRAQPHTSQRVTSKSDVILFSIEHSTYFKLVQGQRDADDHARKMDLLQHLYPAWGDADDEVAGNRRESDIAKMARILKLKTFQPGQHLVQQDREMAEIHFVLSGEVLLKVDVSLKEAFPGATKEPAAEQDQSDLLGAAAINNTQNRELRKAESLGAQIQFLHALTPRQLGTVKSGQYTFATKCRGDSIGVSHVWKEYQKCLYSAVAKMPTEVASVSVQSFKKDFPSRFLTLQYKVSELDYAQSSSTLIRLLHIEALEGWRSQKTIAEILPQLPQRIPSFVGGSQGSSSRKLNKSILEVKENIEDPADRKRRLLFSMACQSMNNVQTKRGSDEEATFLSEEDALASPTHRLLFGGRDQLRRKDWAPFVCTPSTPRTPQTPYQHPRPATVPTEPWWIQQHTQSRARLFEEGRTRALKQPSVPRNASVSKDPYRRHKPATPQRRVQQPTSLMKLPDPNGATLEFVEQIRSRATYLTPRKVHRLTLRSSA